MRLTPSDDFVRESIKPVSPEWARRWGDAQVNATVRRGRKKGMLYKIGSVGIDVTDDGYYGHGVKEYVGSSAKNGTTKFISYIAMRGRTLGWLRTGQGVLWARDTRTADGYTVRLGGAAAWRSQTRRSAATPAWRNRAFWPARDVLPRI